MQGKDEFRAAAKDWFEYGDDDLEMARIGLERNGPPNTIVFLLQQSVEKYLKAYLIWHTGVLTKTHNLELLIDKASAFNDRIAEFTDLGRRLTATYTLERYPREPRAIPEPEEVVEIYNKTKQLIAEISTNWNGNGGTLGG